VRSTVRRTEFIWRRTGSKGASSNTTSGEQSNIFAFVRELSRLTSSIIETLIRQRFRIPRNNQISVTILGDRSEMFHSQFPHCAHNCPCVRRCNRRRRHGGISSPRYSREHEAIDDLRSLLSFEENKNKAQIKFGAKRAIDERVASAPGTLVEPKLLSDLSTSFVRSVHQLHLDRA
jgi:hypothetical protein